jgi:DNA replicative helicase MCM subunit Mcm2 (Cdc46/Mcm family)
MRNDPDPCDDPGKSLEEMKQYLLDLVGGEDPPNFMTPFFCPEVIGHENVKLGLLCCLVTKWDDPEMRQRIHVLLKGVRGTGKSAFINHLTRRWGALYLSGEAKRSSLKGDGRKEDGGVRLLTKYHGGIVCHDEIEDFKDIDSLRDVLEDGVYTDTKGGRHEVFPAQCRYVAAANDISKVSAPILSRFDLVYGFQIPSIGESVAIVRKKISGLRYPPLTEETIKAYVTIAQSLAPVLTPSSREELDEKAQPFEEYFISIDEGRSGRWVESVLRIATTLAKLRLQDTITVRDIRDALEMKLQSDAMLEEPYYE